MLILPSKFRVQFWHESVPLSQSQVFILEKLSCDWLKGVLLGTQDPLEGLSQLKIGNFGCWDPGESVDTNIVRLREKVEKN